MPRFASRLVDVACGFLAYVGARLTWGRREGLGQIHMELFTFALIFLLGVLLGRIAEVSWIRSGVQTVLVAVVTVLLIYMLTG